VYVWTAFNWLRIGTSGWLLEHGNEFFGFYKIWEYGKFLEERSDC